MSDPSPRWLLLLALTACTASGDKSPTDTDATGDTDVVVTDTDAGADTDVPTCAVLPTCTGFGALPAAPTYLDTPSDVMSTGDATGCAPPKMLLALRDITVFAAQDDIAGDVIYCVTQVESPNGGEIRVTSPTHALNEGDSATLLPTDGTIWGDIDTPRAPGGTMLITIDCLEADTVDARAALVTDIANGATSAGGVQNGDLWSFARGEPIAAIVSAATVASDDDLLFNAQMTVEGDDLIALGAGATWSVRRSGTASLSDWDWGIGLVVWGCSDNGH